jgi:hypothetical protein
MMMRLITFVLLLSASALTFAQQFLDGVPYSTPQTTTGRVFSTSQETDLPRSPSSGSPSAAAALGCVWRGRNMDGALDSSGRRWRRKPEDDGFILGNTDTNHQFKCIYIYEGQDIEGNWFTLSSFNYWGTLKYWDGDIVECQSPDTRQHTLDGEQVCYNPFAFDDALSSTCPNSSTDDDFFIVTSSSFNQGCKANDQDAMCGYSNAGGGVFQRDFEMSCYSDIPYPNLDLTEIEIPQIADNACTPIGESLMCADIEENVCFEGDCMTGCGTVGSGGESVFICLSGDLDTDGVPDYLDPDRDGDGIRNDLDLDNNGDGIDDVNETTRQAERLAQGIGGSSGGGGGGGGVGMVGGATGTNIRELGEGLTEIFTIDPTIATRLEASQTSLGTALDEAMANENFQLATTVSETGLIAAFSRPIALFQQETCANPSIAVANTVIEAPICESAAMVRPWLYVVLAVMTVLYCSHTVRQTIRES